MQKQDKEKVGSYYTDGDFIFTTESDKNIKISNLRRSYAKKLFENVVQLKTVQKLLEYSDISITANIYTHVVP